MRIRLPLQVGTSAFWSLTRCATLLLPATALFLVALPIVAVIAWEATDLGKTIGSAILFGCVAVLAALYTLVRSAVRHLWIALRERPSDVVIDDDVLRVIGGPWHGRTVQLAPVKVSVRRTTHGRIDLAELVVDGVALAAAARPVEQASLDALADTIAARAQAAHGPQAGAAAPGSPVHGEAPESTGGERAAGGAGLLCCAKCDAAAVPDDAETVTCRYCGAVVAMPSELRERIRAQRTVARTDPANARMLGRLVDQPSARAIGGVMIGLGVPILAVWPAASVTAFLLYRHEVLGVVSTLVLLLAAVLAIAALFFLMRAPLVNRQALSLVSMRFAAHAPRQAGDSPRCRSCLAPLPGDGSDMLVCCAYCSAENILGLDLRAESRQAVAQQRSLGDELRRRRHERRVWAALAIASLVVLGANRWILPAAFRPRTDRARCVNGDAAACVRDGLANERVAGAPGGYLDDLRMSLDELTRACTLGVVAGCREGARVAYSWKHWDGDAQTLPILRRGCDAGDGRACDVAAVRVGAAGPESFALYQRACALHDMGGCSDLGYAYAKGEGVAVDAGKALAYYQQACDGGFMLGCRNAGWQLERREPPDLVAAAARFERGCTGDLDQCAAAAAFWFRRCDAGDPDGCRKSADHYLALTGISDDKQRALTKACEGGYAEACRGQISMYDKACSEGDRRACKKATERKRR